MYKLLPRWLYDLIIKNYLIDYVYEIRIRENKPIKINYRGKYETLFQNASSEQDYNSSLCMGAGLNAGSTVRYSSNLSSASGACYGVNYNSRLNSDLMTTKQLNPIIATRDLINYVVTVATKKSIYAYNDEIKNCYIQSENGIRIGVCGTVVYDNQKILTIKNITSLNIRVAHEIIDCSKKVIDFICYNKCVKNTLILSAPGLGKTTMVRDITRKLSDEQNIENLLLIDERFEIAGGGSLFLNVGGNTDILSGADKSFSFKQALKTMTPTVIITDEITNDDDICSVMQAINSGVKVIATTHASSITDIKTNSLFNKLVAGKYFERYVLLSNKNGVGTIDSVFDENFKLLYVPYLKWK